MPATPLRESYNVRDTKLFIEGSAPEIPIMLRGEPGVGKTDLVFQVADDLGADVTVLRLSEMRPEDMAMPVPHEDGYVEFMLLKRLKDLTQDADIPEAEKERPHIVFMDELPNADPQTLVSIQQMVLNRTLGNDGTKIRDNVRFIAAGNRAEHGAYTRQLSTAIMSRFLQLDLKPDLTDWVAWAHENGIEPTVISFVQSREEFFNTFDPKTNEDTYACPRTWAMASSVLQSFDRDRLEAAGKSADEIDGFRRKAVASAVGQEVAREYMAFERHAIRAPSADEIVADPGGVDTFNEQPDIALAVTENLWRACVRDPDTYVDGSLQYISRLHAEYQQIVVPKLIGVEQDSHPVPQAVVARVLSSPHATEFAEFFDRSRQASEAFDGASRKHKRAAARAR